MRKLLLTSAGFENHRIGETFLELVHTSPSEITVIFIPTASRTKEEMKYVEMARKEIIGLGVKKEHVKTLDLDHDIRYQEVKDYNVIYVCGGNTFYLLQKVRETGFDMIVKQFVDDGKLYVGVSAGSILACPSIEIALPFDENDAEITDFRGLGLVDVVITPHYTAKEKRIIDKWRKKLSYPIITLTDNQALLVVGKEKKIIE